MEKEEIKPFKLDDIDDKELRSHYSRRSCQAMCLVIDEHACCMGVCSGDESGAQSAYNSLKAQAMIKEVPFRSHESFESGFNVFKNTPGVFQSVYNTMKIKAANRKESFDVPQSALEKFEPGFNDFIKEEIKKHKERQSQEQTVSNRRRF